MTAYIAPGLQTPEEIIAREFNVSMEDIIGRSREEHNVEPRRIIMWYYKKHKGYSYARSAKLVKRDHATAMNAVRRVEGFLKVDKAYRRTIADILEKIEIVKSNT